MGVISKNVSQAQYPVNLWRNKRYRLELLQEILLQPNRCLSPLFLAVAKLLSSFLKLA